MTRPKLNLRTTPDDFLSFYWLKEELISFLREQGFARMQIAFYASTPSYKPVMDLHGWGETAEKLSGFAAKGEWAEMPMLITDEMLSEFCLITTQENLATDLKKKYNGIADRLTLYTPFVPKEKDEWWKELANSFK